MLRSAAQGLLRQCARLAARPAGARLSSTVTASDLEVDARNLDVGRAAAIYKEHGCLVVRGLNRKYVDAINKDVELHAEQALRLMPQKERIAEGWVTPDTTLVIPAPKHFHRDVQIMVLGMDYFTSGALLKASTDEKCLDICEAVLGPNVEIFGKGQIIYKEPVGGHAKFLHQDGAYFQFSGEGALGTLNYCVDTNLTLDNGPLHVVPGSHKLGYLTHYDTESHLGLDPEEWSFSKAIPIEGDAGDTIFFHIHCIHGSKYNNSDKPRPVFINRYLRPDDVCLIQAATAKARAEREKEAKENPPPKTRGYMVRGRREYTGQRWHVDFFH